MAKESTVHFKIALPTVLKDRLAEAAERSGRSLSSEMITRLEASLSLNDEGIDLTFDGLTKMIDGMVADQTNPIEDRLTALEHDVSAMRRNMR